MAKRVKFNVRNVYYAKMTIGENDAVSYAAPVAIPGAVTLALDPEGENSIFWADGERYYESYGNNGYSGNLEVAEFPDSFKQDILGYVKDATTGKLTEFSDVEPEHFALLFQMDGSPEKTRFVFYNVLPSRENVDAETTTETKEPKTESIDISVSNLPNGAVRSVVHESDAAFATWFDSVTAPTRS